MTWVAILSGIILATFAASGVYFLKFWRASHDRFYLFFSLTCWLLAFERIAVHSTEGAFIAVRNEITEANAWVYLMRLAAFLFLTVAILEKNRTAK